MSGWKTKECSIGKELARRNIELEEEEENCTECGIRQEASVKHKGSEICVIRPGRTTNEAGSIINNFLKLTDQILGAPSKK